MRHDVQVRLVKELLARLDSGTNVDAGGLRLQPTSAYTDPDLAAREWEEFFLGHPQLIGLSGDLPEPGSFFTVDDLGAPILATRDADGVFRAMVNSCRHRGAIVESRSRGVARRFTCPFHAWSYDSGGALVGLPKPEHFGDVDRECHGLIQLPAEERHGLLFVHPDRQASLDLDAHLGPEFDEEFSTWHYDELVRLTEDTYETACNWKLAMDTFGETYHFPALHQNTLINSFHGNVQCYDDFGHNHRMVLCRREIDEMRKLPEAEWDITVAALPVYWIFPNSILMPFLDGCFLVRAYPATAEPSRHVSRIDFYLRPGANPKADALTPEVYAELAQMFARIIRDEDYAMGESQQRAADAGSLDRVVFGRNEPALHHYHNTYRAKLGIDPLPLLDDADV